jgi:hypothetical protein
MSDGIAEFLATWPKARARTTRILDHLPGHLLEYPRVRAHATTRTSTRAPRATRCSPTGPHRARRQDVLGRRRRDVVGAARHHPGPGDPRGPHPRLSVTGANLEESLFRLVAHHSYKDFPDYRYFTKQDDTKILAQRMRRVTDTSIPEDEAFRAVEKIIVPMWTRRPRTASAASGTSTSTS